MPEAFSFSPTGTAGDDFLLGGPNSSTMSGLDGDDFILGDNGGQLAPSTSTSLVVPVNIDDGNGWTTIENPFFGNASIPHLSLYVLTEAGQTYYSSVTVGAGQTITVDIDFGYLHPIGVSTDVYVQLYNTSDTIVAFNDDGGGGAPEGAGSVSGFDSFLSFTNATGTAQVYTIRFREFGDVDLGAFEAGETFVANISVTGHAAIAPVAMGNDILNGGNGDDTLAGQGGDDNIFGNAGIDTLFGGSGNDLLDGGDGIDTADYGDAAAGVVVNLGLGALDTLGAGFDTLLHIENISGSRFDDTLTGDSLDNALTGWAGADILNGGAANDTLNGGTGNDTASYAGAASAVTVNLNIGGAQDTLGAGVDVLSSIEQVTGSDFDDQLTGNADANTLSGGNGADTLAGLTGNDSLFGGGGGDLLAGHAGNDRLDGGAGIDTASYALALTGVFIDLSEPEENAIGDGVDTLISIENVVGSDYDDTVIGSAAGNLIETGTGNDFVSSGDGDDVILGDVGDDTLLGGAGIDFIQDFDGSNVLVGGTGNDLISGGGGHDVLHGGGGDDQIFDIAGDDRIEGGSGIDELSYANGAGVLVDLSVTGAQDTVGGGIDTISGIEHLTGSFSADSLAGNGGDNRLSGTSGDDILSGADGNDTLDGGDGNDTLAGGNGVDTASYISAGGAVAVNLALVGLQITGGAGSDTLGGIENLIGSVLGDTLTGNSGINVLSGSSGNDNLYGGDGNDTLAGDFGDDALDGGAGNDTASYASATIGVVINLAIVGAQSPGIEGADTLTSIERLTGSSFNDTLTGNAGVNVLFGSGGNDSLNGGADADSLLGGDGNDILIGGTGNDSINGGTGNDTVSYVGAAAGVIVALSIATAQNTGGGGTDTLVSIERATGTGFNDVLTGTAAANVLSGEAGVDSLDGGGGDDIVLGGDGNDFLAGGSGNDSLNGGAGFDTASYAGSATAVTVNLASTSAQATGGGGTETLVSIEHLTGSDFNDTLTGSVIANTLSGDSGNDILAGGGGNDSLSGGIGNDTLIGGAGNDALNGNAGTDLFRFDSALSAATNVDTISAFSVADDTMQLSQAVFAAAGALGALTAAAFHTGAAAADASDRIIYNSATGRLYYDSDGLGGAAQIQFAQVSAGLALTNADFGIVG